MKKFLIATAFLAFAMLTSCGDSNLAKQGENVLTQNVYIMPTSVKTTTDKLPLYVVCDSEYLEKDNAYKFYAGFSIDGSLANCDSCYKSLRWVVDGEEYSQVSFTHTFSEPGEKSGALETIDVWGDTLKTEFKLFVNTPASISLVYPINGSDQVSYQNSGRTELKWATEGVDPWETANCTVYASNDRDSVWGSPMGSVDCNSSVSLRGFVDSTNESSTIYWAVIMLVTNAGGKTYNASTDIFSFSTKIDNDSISTVSIPVCYRKLSEGDSTNGTLYLIGGLGDTLQTIAGIVGDTTLKLNLAPQTNITIAATESRHIEYMTKGFTVNVPQNTAVVTDTLFFVDSIAPQIAPEASAFAITDSIRFNVFDAGAGINPGRLTVLIGGDTTEFNYSSPTLAFAILPSQDTALIVIEGEDYAHNSLASVKWNLNPTEDSVYIAGPYLREEN